MQNQQKHIEINDTPIDPTTFTQITHRGGTFSNILQCSYYCKHLHDTDTATKLIWVSDAVQLGALSSKRTWPTHWTRESLEASITHLYKQFIRTHPDAKMLLDHHNRSTFKYTFPDQTLGIWAGKGGNLIGEVGGELAQRQWTHHTPHTHNTPKNLINTALPH